MPLSHTRQTLARIRALPPTNPNQLARAARSLHTTTDKLRAYFKKHQINYPRKAKPLTAEQRAIIEKTFAKYEGFLKRLMTPHLKKKVPRWFLMDLAHRSAVMHMEEYDPNRGTTIETWITNGWEKALKHATTHYLQTKKKEPASIPEAQFLLSRRPSPLEQIVHAENLDLLHRSLKALPTTERNVLELRFGIGEAPPLTQKEIGKRFGLSHERVRQLENRALARLRQQMTPAEPKATTAHTPKNFDPHWFSVLHRLSPLEHNVVSAFFGLENQRPQSVEQIAAALHVSVNRAQLALTRSKRKLSKWT